MKLERRMQGHVRFWIPDAHERHRTWFGHGSSLLSAETSVEGVRSAVQCHRLMPRRRRRDPSHERKPVNISKLASHISFVPSINPILALSTTGLEHAGRSRVVCPCELILNMIFMESVVLRSMGWSASVCCRPATVLRSSIHPFRGSS